MKAYITVAARVRLAVITNACLDIYPNAAADITGCADCTGGDEWRRQAVLACRFQANRRRISSFK